jgi:hypothetical protein
MNDEIQEVLSFDSLHEAEKITGRNYKEDAGVAALGMILELQHREKRNAWLYLTRDTNSWNQTLEEYLAVLEEMKFQLIYTEDIADTGDKLRIFWHSGILLVTDSYWKDTKINSANAYFNYRGPCDGMFRCSHSWIKEVDGVNVFAASKDGREGLRFTLNKMLEVGEILPIWIERPFLWLLHYLDIKQEGYDYATMNESRIAKFPEEVRNAITPKPQHDKL